MQSKHVIQLDGVEIEVSRKRVKNLNIRIYPSEGRVAMSIPRRTSLRTAERFARKKYDWIKKHVSGYKAATRKKHNQFKICSGESHSVWGELLTLSVDHAHKKPSIAIENGEIQLTVRPDTSLEKRRSVLTEWYRAELKREIPVLIEKWEKLMGVSVNEFGVKRMKTRWGTCNIRAKRIWINLELAKMDPSCLEYVIVHEMVHLLERLHSKRFYKLMDHFMPDWKERDHLLKKVKMTC